LKRYPDFLIVGAQKCGTYTLHNWLGSHPECFMSSIKEPHFFARFEPWDKLLQSGSVVRNVDDYKQLFAKATNEQICGESSPSYLFETGVAERILQVIPNCKIIILVRDPVERAFSEYKMNLMGGYEKRSFLDAIKEAANGRERTSWADFPLYIELSKYGTQVARYYNIFPEEQILLMTLDELAQFSVRTMKKVSRFLGIQEGFWDVYNYQVFNTGKVPRNRLFHFLVTSDFARFTGRLVIPKKYRPYVALNILGRASTKKETSFLIDSKAKEIIWSICKGEILYLEKIVGRKIPALWKSYPDELS